jgi:predicted nicotinamide N-methyase
MTANVPFPPDASLDELLALAHKKFKVGFNPVSIGKEAFEVPYISNMTEYVDRLVQGTQPGKTIQLPLWAKIWPASIMLAHAAGQMPCTGRESLLEIGAGLGIPGLVAARHGFSTVISDIDDDALIFARINILKNNLRDTATIRKIDVCSTRTDQKFDIIIASEIQYLPNISQDLVDFLRSSLAPSGTILLARDAQRKENSFLTLATEFFQIQSKKVAFKQHGSRNATKEQFQATLYRLIPKPHK